MMFQFTVKLPEAEALDGSSAGSYGLLIAPNTAPHGKTGKNCGTSFRRNRRFRRTQATNNGQHFLNVGISKRIKKKIIMLSHCRAYKGAQAPDKLRHHNTFLVKGWLERKSASNRLFFFWQKLKETLVNHGFSRQMLVWTRYFKHAMYRIPANFMLNPFCHSVEKWKIQPGSSTVIYWYLSAMKSNLRARGTHFWVAMFGITHPLNFEAISYLMLTICSYKFIYVPLHKQCFFSILGVHLSTVVNNKHLSTAVNDSLIHNTERQISQNCLIYN